MVSELHFYFILVESSLFEDVRMDYLYDLEAKTDLLIRKNGKMLGIQLFSGDENYRLTKEESIKKLQLGYELKLYNLRDHPERKKSLQESIIQKLPYMESLMHNFLQII